jgi:chaperonin GroES
VLHPDKILIRPDDEETVSKGGIHIPETAYSKEKVMFGEVVAYGAGKITGEGKQIAPENMFEGISVGSRVMFGPFAAQPIRVDEVKYLMMRWDDIYALIDDEPADVTANGNSTNARRKTK